MRTLKPRSIRLFLFTFLLLAAFHSSPEISVAKRLYSYTDEQGTAVMTDRYDTIPDKYRSRVTTIQQEEDSSITLGLLPRSIGKQVHTAIHSIGIRPIAIAGLSPHQSEILTYAGILCVICLAAMNLSRSQPIRFLSLWCLIMVAIATPVLLYVSQDGPATIMRSKATQIQDKQLERLKPAQ